MTQSQVASIEKLSENFVQVELSGSPIEKAKWTPGGKIQIDVGGLKFRTFTPLRWGEKEGSLTIIGYRRPGHPATDWLDALRVGEACEVFGPRDSLDFSRLEGKVALFGDETSFGIARVLRGVIGPRAHIFLELNSLVEGQDVLARLGIEAAQTHERSADGAHLSALARGLIEKSGEFSTVFLTGRASSIQRLRTLLKEAGVPGGKLKTRPYWADGKAGLD